MIVNNLLGKSVNTQPSTPHTFGTKAFRPALQQLPDTVSLRFGAQSALERNKSAGQTALEHFNVRTAGLPWANNPDTIGQFRDRLCQGEGWSARDILDEASPERQWLDFLETLLGPALSELMLELETELSQSISEGRPPQYTAPGQPEAIREIFTKLQTEDLKPPAVMASFAALQIARKLSEMGAEPKYEPRIVDIPSIGHAVVVIGLPEKAELNDPTTWGDDAVLIDPSPQTEATAMQVMSVPEAIMQYGQLHQIDIRNPGVLTPHISEYGRTEPAAA